jgi:hypothetical protein
LAAELPTSEKPKRTLGSIYQQVLGRDYREAEATEIARLMFEAEIDPEVIGLLSEICD